MTNTPDNQTRTLDLEKAISRLTPDIFSDDILKNFCRQPNRTWNKLIKTIIFNLEKEPDARQLDQIRARCRELMIKLQQDVRAIKNIKSNEEKGIKQSDFAKSFANRASFALTGLLPAMEELELQKFYNELLAESFNIDSANSNLRFHIWEMMTILTRTKGTGRITPPDNSRASITSVLTIPPSKLEAKDAMDRVQREKNATRKSAEDILAQHLYYKPSTKKIQPPVDPPKAAEKAIPQSFDLNFDDSPLAQPYDLIFVEPVPKRSTELPKLPKVILNLGLPPVAKKPSNSVRQIMTKWVGISAAAAAAMIGITKAEDCYTTSHSTANSANSAVSTTASATETTPAPFISFTSTPATPPGMAETHRSITSSTSKPPALSSMAAARSTPAKAASARPALVANAIPRAAAPIARETQNSTAGHYGFDFSHQNFNKYKETYFKRSLFSTAIDYAAENADVELTGKESKTQAKLALYKAFLESGMKEYAHNGAVRVFFKIRLRNLNILMLRIENGEFNIDKDMPFAGIENYEDRLLWNAVSQPKLKPKADENVRYAVESDINKNPYLATALVQIKDVTGLRNVIKEAVTKISCPVSEQRAFNECAYDTLFKVAEEHRAKDKKDGTVNILTTLVNLDRQNRTTFVGKILRVKKEVPGPAAATPESPATTDIRPATPVAPVFQVAPAKTPTPAETTPPIHSMNTPAFNNEDKSWFTEGEKLSTQHQKEAEDNRKWVAAYPEWFPDEPKPERPGYVARAVKFVKNIFSPAQKSAEELEQAELKQSLPKKSFWQNLVG